MVRRILKLYATKRIAELEEKLNEETVNDYKQFMSILAETNLSQLELINLETLFNKQITHGFELGFDNGLNEGVKIGVQLLEMTKSSNQT